MHEGGHDAEVLGLPRVPNGGLAGVDCHGIAVGENGVGRLLEVQEISDDGERIVGEVGVEGEPRPPVRFLVDSRDNLRVAFQHLKDLRTPTLRESDEKYLRETDKGFWDLRLPFLVFNREEPAHDIRRLSVRKCTVLKPQ